MSCVVLPTLACANRCTTCCMSSRSCSAASKKGHGAAVLAQHRQGLVDLDDDLRLAAAQAAGLDLVIVAPLGRGHLVQSERALKDLLLHLQHLAEAGFEHRQHPLDFLLAELAKDLLQFGLGLFQFRSGFLLLLAGRIGLGLLSARLRPLSSAAGRLEGVCGPDCPTDLAAWA